MIFLIETHSVQYQFFFFFVGLPVMLVQDQTPQSPIRRVLFRTDDIGAHVWICGVPMLLELTLLELTAIANIFVVS